MLSRDARALDVPAADGVHIHAVRPASLFERIGLRSGDVILEIDGVPLDDPLRAVDAFDRALRKRDAVLARSRGGRIVLLRLSPRISVE